MGDHKHKKDSKKSSSKREHSSHGSHRDHKKHKKSNSSKRNDETKEIDYSDPSLWVEAPGTTEITPAEHLRNHQQADLTREEQPAAETLPQQEEARHGWMLDGGLDFGSMGIARVREEDKPKRNPDEVSIHTASNAIM
jgi:hypothetical protein